MIKVGIISLGCSKNRVDTERILGGLRSVGLRFTAQPEFADVIIVNTCGFIASAKEESINTVLEMAQYKLTGNCKLLIMTGCMSQRYDKELREEMPEVDIFWGVKDHEGLVGEICKKLNISTTNMSCSHRLLTTPSYSAYLRIADGCDNRCTYCAIPLIRGGMRSVPMEELIAEAKTLAKAGVKEITAIAQDTSAYGKDIYGKPMLAELLTELNKIEGFRWIRVLYAYPNTVTRELVDTMIACEKVVPYIDMPIQHISMEMLKKMNRHGSAEHIREITKYIREVSDKFVLRTTVMLGFPGETQADVDELASFLSEHPFDRLGAFTYSPEDGTLAAEYTNQIDEDTQKLRYDKIMLLQQQVSQRLNKTFIGKELDVLVERVENGYAVGRSYAHAPDVDGVVFIKGSQADNLAPGEFVKVNITEASEYDLTGEML